MELNRIAGNNWKKKKLQHAEAAERLGFNKMRDPSESKGPGRKEEKKRKDFSQPSSV